MQAASAGVWMWIEETFGRSDRPALVSTLARLPKRPMKFELLDEVAAKGFAVAPGEMGENITTRGIDLLALSRGARLHIGSGAIVEITGLRNPCAQIDKFQKGVLGAVVDRDAAGNVVRKAGVMGIVIAGGEVSAGDAIRVEAPAGPHVKLEWV